MNQHPGMSDEIQILGLEMPVHLGVPEEERASPQVVTADIRLVLKAPFSDMKDEISATVDYERAANEAVAIAGSRPRKLLEVLAADLMKHFLANDSVASVEVLLRKRILPHTECVAVRMHRTK
jgi:dihydroneopterin aldolase